VLYITHIIKDNELVNQSYEVLQTVLSTGCSHM